jgi:hypothetical protein
MSDCAARPRDAGASPRPRSRREWNYRRSLRSTSKCVECVASALWNRPGAVGSAGHTTRPGTFRPQPSGPDPFHRPQPLVGRQELTYRWRVFANRINISIGRAPRRRRASRAQALRLVRSPPCYPRAEHRAALRARPRPGCRSPRRGLASRVACDMLASRVVRRGACSHIDAASPASRRVMSSAEPHGARMELVVPNRVPARSVAQPVADTESATTFRTGQAVWLNGRAASFCYEVEPRTAVIRYDGEPRTRVVPLRKLAPARPSDEPQIRQERSRSED